MAIYLLDFENVHDSGITGVTSLAENDELYIFYSVKSEHMSFETHVSIMKSACKVKYIKLRRAAKNYLDFQLCTHLGYLIGAGFEGPFFIISKDTGYDSAIDYWKDHGVTIIRQPSISFSRNSGKSTGQNPAHNTPPAIVTFREGGQVITPDVSLLYRIDTGKEPAVPANEPVDEPFREVPDGPVTDEEIMSLPAEEAVKEETSTTPAGKKKKTGKKSSAKEEETPQDDAQIAAAAEDASSQTAVGGRSSQKSRSRKGSSKKTAQSQANEEAAGEESAPASETAEQPAAEDVKVSEDNTETVPIKPDTLPESYRKRVRTALKGKNIPSAYYSSIYKAILNSYDKLALNNLLVKTFGSSKGGEVYKLLKDIFMDFQS